MSTSKSRTINYWCKIVGILDNCIGDISLYNHFMIYDKGVKDACGVFIYNYIFT